MSQTEIETLFTYVPPTSQTLPLFQQIKESERMCYKQVFEVFSALPAPDASEAFSPLFTVITESVKDFAVQVDALVPSGWGTAKELAVTALVEARAAFNDALMSYRAGEGERMRLAYDLGMQSLIKARLLACYGITFAYSGVAT